MTKIPILKNTRANKGLIRKAKNVYKPNGH